MFRYASKCLLTTTTLLLFGCAVVDLPASQREHGAYSHLDQAVLSCVLMDLTTYNGERCPFPRGISVPRTLIVSSQPVQSSPDPKTPLAMIRRHNSWKQPDSDDSESIEEALRNSVDRFESKNNSVPLSLEGDRIEVSQLPNVESDPRLLSKDTAPVRLWYPGYSLDGDWAIVHLHFPKSRSHAATGTYIVRRQGTRWHIVSRDFNFFI